jgi:DNA-binding NarL/FixJ family response regulator
MKTAAEGRVSMSSDSGLIHILLADSDDLRSQMLASALRRRSEFVVQTCVMDADIVGHTFLQFDIDVVLLSSDARGPEVCLPIIRRIHLARPQVSPVLLSETLSSELVVNAFRSGVRGVFCHANASLRELCKCIRCVHEGQVWANSQQLCCLLDVLARVPSLRMLNSGGDHLLTGREEQVVALVSDGMSNREVARELNLSEHTIKKYLFRIFDKLGVSTRVELVLYAMSHGNSREAEWIPGN